ncbi:hypothetical protein MEY_05668 [Candida albicans 19F]|nr:hypothetical protein MEY_05668 [Candida albicans 19F]
MIPQWMSQDENIIKDLNNNEQSSLTPFSNWNGIINRIKEKVIFYEKYQRYIRAYIPHAGNFPDEKMLKFRFRPSFNFSIITEMQTESGNTVQDTEIMINLATKFYQDLFSVEDRHLESFTFVEQFDKKIDDTDKVLLEKAFIEENVYDHLLMINKKTAVGTDGISYQNLIELWPSLGESLIRAGNNILKYGTLPQQMSEVIITLIPKKSKTPIIENFRPISVISCAVRLLSSVIEKQLNPVLEKVIEKTQTGFLKERSISNSIYLLDMVLTRYQTSKTADAESAGFINLDFRKAFDSVHHDFILKVLQQVGFGPKATNFLMAITAKQKAKVSINNIEGPCFPLKRGVRQGNPISPLIFILILETFLARLSKEIEGIGVVNEVSSVAYTAYADDVIIFFKNKNDQERIQQLLEDFGRESGLYLNNNKTEVCYFNDIPEISFLPYVSKKLQLEKLTYLGVPMKKADEEFDPWTSFVLNLNAQIRMTPISDLPYQLIMKLMNIFIFSKLYYRDLHSPISTTAVSSIITTVQQRLPLYFKLQRLQTPNHLGGFGLMNPNHQVKGRRGKQIYLLYTQEDDLIIKFMRTKIQDILDNIAKDYYTMPTEPDKLIVYPWYLFGMGVSCHSSLQFRYLKERVYENLTKSEISWFEAWFQLVHYTGPPVETPIIIMSIEDYANLIIQPQTESIKLMSPNFEEQSLSEQTFHHTSRKLCPQAPIIPEGWGKHFDTIKSLTISDWTEFWKNMNKVQKQSVGSLQDYHLFILGYYSHYPFYPNYKKSEIHFCQLCNTGTDSIVHHIFECGETMELWSKHFNSQRTPQFIIGNKHLHKKDLYALNEYIKEVVQKVKRRRGSPILNQGERENVDAGTNVLV